MRLWFQLEIGPLRLAVGQYPGDFEKPSGATVGSKIEASGNGLFDADGQQDSQELFAHRWPAPPRVGF